MSEPNKVQEQKLRNAAYNKALVLLKDNHPDEFRQLVTAECAARGVSYKSRRTPAEAAADQLRKLLAAHPELATQVQQANEQPVGSVTQLTDPV